MSRRKWRPPGRGANCEYYLAPPVAPPRWCHRLSRLSPSSRRQPWMKLSPSSHPGPLKPRLPP
eukprot:scaffold176850_cov26-Tisochrysis_lutea.AAC.1